MLQSSECPELSQEFIGGVGIAVEDELLQRAAKEELQGARTQQPLDGHVVEQELCQLWRQTGQTADVLHAGSCVTGQRK